MTLSRCQQSGLVKLMREYIVIYERAKDGGWGAYVPDLPGLGVVGETLEEVEALIREGMKLHIAGLIEDGLPVPEPVTQSARIAVPA
jgi:predicted RNase H-like HicB family nuclease